jgi:P-type Ca2+ transporter type 2C
MTRPPRPRGESVVTPHMWFTIIFIGIVSAACSLAVLDASLPGGFIEGSGNMRYGQTMAFTTMVFCSLFSAFGARSDERSAFQGLFANLWLWAAVALAVVLQALVIYVPFLQRAFSTVGLSPVDWLRCVVASSFVLWLTELSKLVLRQILAQRKKN